MANSPAPELSKEQFNETRSYLQSEFDVAPYLFDRPRVIWTELSQRAENYQLIRVSHEKYYRAIIRRALYTVHSKSIEEEEELIKTLCEKLGIKPSKKYDPITLIARTVINYDKGKEDKKGNARKVWARDAAAIRQLISEKIQPADIIDYLRDNLGGLERLARKWYGRHSIRTPKTRSNEAGTAALKTEAVTEGLAKAAVPQSQANNEVGPATLKTEPVTESSAKATAQQPGPRGKAGSLL